MRTFKYFLLLAALFVVALHSPGRSASIPGQFQDFTLTLATPKAQYIELQPIPLVITLKNETNEPLVGHNALEFGTGFLQLYVDRGDGPQEIAVSPFTKTVIAPPREFKPGEEVQKLERLSFKLNKAFPQPGTYRMHVRLISNDGKESVSSKPIEVEIVAPDGLDAHALQFIRDNSDPAYFYSGIRAVKKAEQLQVLENFVAVYGESTYADEALFALGEVQFARRDYQKARKFFEKLSKKSDYAFAGEATDYLKQIEHEEKKKERP
jgi:hypothetical protein